MPSRHVFLILRHIWITPGVRPYKVPAGITCKDLLRVVFVTFLDHRQLKKGNFLPVMQMVCIANRRLGCILAFEHNCTVCFCK